MEDLEVIKSLTLSDDLTVYSGAKPSGTSKIYTGLWGAAEEVGKTDSSYWFKVRPKLGTTSHPYAHIPILESAAEFSESIFKTRCMRVDLKDNEQCKAAKPPEGKAAWPIVIFDLGDHNVLIFDVLIDCSWEPPEGDSTRRLFHMNTLRILTPEEHEDVVSGARNVCYFPTNFMCPCCGHV